MFSVAGSRLILNLRASAVAGSTPGAGAGLGSETLEMMQFDKNPAGAGVQLDSFADTDGNARLPGGLRFVLPSGSELGSGSSSRRAETQTGTGTSSGGTSSRGSEGEKRRYVTVLGVGSVGSVGNDDGTYASVSVTVGAGEGEKGPGPLVLIPDSEDERSVAYRREGGPDDEEAARPRPGSGPGDPGDPGGDRDVDVADPEDWMAEWGKLML